MPEENTGEYPKRSPPSLHRHEEWSDIIDIPSIGPPGLVIDEISNIDPSPSSPFMSSVTFAMVLGSKSPRWYAAWEYGVPAHVIPFYEFVTVTAWSRGMRDAGPCHHTRPAYAPGVSYILLTGAPCCVSWHVGASVIAERSHPLFTSHIVTCHQPLVRYVVQTPVSSFSTPPTRPRLYPCHAVQPGKLVQRVEIKGACLLVWTKFRNVYVLAGPGSWVGHNLIQ